MFTQGSSALREVVEIAKIVKSKNISASQFYAISDGGGGRRVDYLTIRKVLIGMFLVHNLDELLLSVLEQDILIETLLNVFRTWQI